MAYKEKIQRLPRCHFSTTEYTKSIVIHIHPCIWTYLFVYLFVRVIKFVEYKFWKYSNGIAYEAKVRNGNITHYIWTVHMCMYTKICTLPPFMCEEDNIRRRRSKKKTTSLNQNNEEWIRLTRTCIGCDIQQHICSTLT